MIELMQGNIQMFVPGTSEPVYEFNNVNGLVETEVDAYSLSQESLTFNHEATFTADIEDTAPIFTYVTDLSDKPVYIEYNVPIMVQARWHKKPRINKKWLKRYGMKKDTVLVRCKAISMYSDYERENPYEIEYCFNLGSMEYKFRPDQLRRNLKLEVSR